MRIVVDTSVLIDFLRRRDAESSVYFRLVEKGEISISLITVAELLSGSSAQTLRGKKYLDKLLQGVRIHAPNFKQAQIAGKLRFKYNISLMDAFVAALAMDQKLPLASLDLKTFKKIKGLKLYFLNN